MTVWAILICNVLMGALGLALSQANEAAKREIRTVYRRHGLRGGPAGCAVAVLAYANVGLWTVYAIQQHDWRFAAVVWVPMVLTWIGQATAAAKVRLKGSP